MGSDPQSYLQHQHDTARPDLQQRIYGLEGQVRSYIEALNHWRKAYDLTQLEARVRDWVTSRIGPGHMTGKARAARLLEEALELAQAEGITEPEVAVHMMHVYNRPIGEPAKEAAGVAICLYGWCASRGLRLTEIAAQELERIEARSAEDIQKSLARKEKAGLLFAKVEPARKDQPFEYDQEDGGPR